MNGTSGLAGETAGEIPGVAAEVVENRSYTHHGAPQRHYLLTPALVTPDGVCTGVVVVPGSLATYVYPGDSDGDIADYFPVGKAPVGTSREVILNVMGYRIATTHAELLDAV